MSLISENCNNDKHSGCNGANCICNCHASKPYSGGGEVGAEEPAVNMVANDIENLT